LSEPLDVRRLIEAIQTWAAARPHGCRTAGTRGGLSFIQLHTRPDPRAPEVQFTLRAAIVDGQPVIQVPELEASNESSSGGPGRNATATEAVALPIESAATAHEADAICEGCRRTGTIGRAVRTAPTGQPTEVHRFCAACWPEQSARYRARWQEEDRIRGDQFLRDRIPARGAGYGMYFAAATWHAALEIVEHVERSMIPSVPPSPEALARLAADIERQAPELNDEMPFAVEAFIRRYGRPRTDES
jgi:hypothetical protein